MLNINCNFQNMTKKGKQFFLLVFSSLFLTSLFPHNSLLAEEIHLMAGAGLRQPTDQLIEEFKLKTGHIVFVNYDGGGRLLASIIASGQGDLYMPGAFQYIKQLEDKNMVHSFCKIVSHTPVIAVNRNNNSINSFDDLARPGVRLGLGDPKAMAFGQIAMDIFRASETENKILNNVIVYGATVKQLALYVAQGDIDASIIGRADALQYKKNIRIVPIPSEYFTPETIAIAVLSWAADQPEVISFRDFMCSKRAIEVFHSYGFLPLKVHDE
jgi:molybdate transport system substrate-binding protein